MAGGWVGGRQSVWSLVLLFLLKEEVLGIPGPWSRAASFRGGSESRVNFKDFFFFFKLGLVSPGVYNQDRGESAPVKSTFPLHT